MVIYHMSTRQARTYETNTSEEVIDEEVLGYEGSNVVAREDDNP
jgi:hypothetical protein